MLSHERWRIVVGTGVAPRYPDGPDLLLPEIAALLYGQRVWVPFQASSALVSERWLGPSWQESVCSGYIDGTIPLPLPPEHLYMNALYFGVPTIVKGRALFKAPGWDKETARVAARILTKRAIQANASLIVSGLGSGDISVADRIEDMGGGEVVTYKKFHGFEDWVIVRRV